MLFFRPPVRAVVAVRVAGAASLMALLAACAPLSVLGAFIVMLKMNF